MMNQTLILSVILFSLSQAQASTHFDDLKQMFAQGSKPSKSELISAYSGRCFYEASVDSSVSGPNDATGSILVGQMIVPTQQPANPADDGGPLFPAPPAQ